MSDALLPSNPKLSPHQVEERLAVIRKTVEDCLKFSPRNACTWGHEADILFLLEQVDALRALLTELIDIEGPQPGHVMWFRKVQAALGMQQVETKAAP